MRGTDTALTNVRRAKRTTPADGLASTVLASVLASAAVAVTCTAIVAVQVHQARDARAHAAASASAEAREVVLDHVRPAEPDRRVAYAPSRLADPMVARAVAPGLAAPEMDAGYLGPATVQVIAGVQVMIPPRRPAAAAAAYLARLEGNVPEADTALAVLRPPERPVTMSTRSPDAADVTAPATPEAEVVLAAVSPAEDDRLLRPAPRSVANPCVRRLTRAIPRRPANAPSGSELVAELMGSGGGVRDSALATQALRGNMPSHLRTLSPVSFQGIIGGRQADVTICVTPDYLAVGSDADHVRVPLGLPAALQVADAFDMMLPTTRMVDAIYAQAQVRLSPRPMEPGAQMVTTEYFTRHDAALDAQLANAGGRAGMLVAGHKKDVVIANRLSSAPGRIAIYGWHRASGNPIQPLSTVHGADYADYSHGIRLVSRTAYVNGRPVDIRALLTDGRYAEMLNGDGPLSSATIRLAALQ
ncbi:MAG: hypothetical protein NXH79_02280 [Rhodobacteraceae bacterium]|nr:hypothetical protein [Paracoccaceae bacterium]